MISAPDSLRTLGVWWIDMIDMDRLKISTQQMWKSSTPGVPRHQGPYRVDPWGLRICSQIPGIHGMSGVWTWTYMNHGRHEHVMNMSWTCHEHEKLQSVPTAPRPCCHGAMVPWCHGAKCFSKPATYSSANSSARRWLWDELLSTSPAPCPYHLRKVGQTPFHFRRYPMKIVGDNNCQSNK